MPEKQIKFISTLKKALKTLKWFMQKLLIRQASNYLRTIGVWQQIQIGLIALSLFLFLSGKLGFWFDQSGVKSWQLTLWIYAGFVLLNIASAPFIFKYALPKQKALQVFQTLPLDTHQLNQLLAFYYLKVQLPLIFFQLIITSGLVYASFFAGFMLLLASAFSGYLVFFIAFRQFLAQSTGLIDLLGAIANHSKRSTKRIKPASGFGLFRKELYSLWRNPRYRRLKVFTFIFYFITLFILNNISIKNNDMWMMLFSTFVFWMHYNVHFNSKYVSAEPDWFFRTLPVKFHRAWFSRFFAEFSYIIFLLGAQWLFLALVGIEFSTQIQWIGALLLFAVIILTIVLNFQILFYDNPRLAGYAYHFTIIFILVSSYNYRLVGPLSAFFLLAYFTYLTRRFYTS